MNSYIVKNIVFMPKGVQGLRLQADEHGEILPLRRGERISFKVSGPSVLRPPKNPCTLCDGTRCLKGRPDCTVPHILYLALFGRIVKVGVTKEKRYERRIREQGAPFATKISRHEDGMEARRAEKILASGEGLRMGVRFEEKVNSIGRVCDVSQANHLISGMPLPNGLELTDMRCLYQNPDLEGPSRPIILRGGAVRGKIEDTRGEALFLTYRDNLYAYDLRRTIGRILTLGGAKVKAQLTLGNF